MNDANGPNPRVWLANLLYECTRWLKTEWKWHRLIGWLAVLFSLLLSLVKGDPKYFSSSGSILTLAGMLMTFRGYLRGMNNPYLRDTGQANRRAFEQADLLNDKSDAAQQDDLSMRWGIWFLASGTLIWGYGDLVLGFIIQTCKAA